MKDKNFSIDQLEDLLAPHQEFHVCGDFTARVMEAAKAGLDAPVRRRARLRWAWTGAAAAAVAAVIVVGLFLPVAKVTPADAPVQVVVEIAPSGTDEDVMSASDNDVAVASVSNSTARVPEQSSPRTMRQDVAQAVAEAEAEAGEPEEPVSVAKESATLYAMNSIRVSNNVMVDDLGGEIVLETDLPITNLDNYELTPEEEQLALHYQREEFLEGMRADLEIARMIVENCMKEK